MVVKNDKWTPGGKEAKYYEVEVNTANGKVNIADGKLVVSNANKPDLYHSVGMQAKNEKGQFIAEPPCTTKNPSSHILLDRQ